MAAQRPPTPPTSPPGLLKPKRQKSGLSQQASGTPPAANQPLSSQPGSQTDLPAKTLPTKTMVHAANKARTAGNKGAATAGGDARALASAMAATAGGVVSAGSEPAAATPAGGRATAGGGKKRARIVPGGKSAVPPTLLPPATQPLVAVGAALAAGSAAPPAAAQEAAQDAVHDAAQAPAPAPPEPFFNPFLKASYAKPTRKCADGSEDGSDGAAQQAPAKRRRTKPELVDEAELGPPLQPVPVTYPLCVFPLKWSQIRPLVLGRSCYKAHVRALWSSWLAQHPLLAVSQTCSVSHVSTNMLSCSGPNMRARVPAGHKVLTCRAGTPGKPHVCPAGLRLTCHIRRRRCASWRCMRARGAPHRRRCRPAAAPATWPRFWSSCRCVITLFPAAFCWFLQSLATLSGFRTASTAATLVHVWSSGLFGS